MAVWLLNQDRTFAEIRSAGMSAAHIGTMYAMSMDARAHISCASNCQSNNNSGGGG
jgi:hypothetical protein